MSINRIYVLCFMESTLISSIKYMTQNIEIKCMFFKYYTFLDINFGVPRT